MHRYSDNVIEEVRRLRSLGSTYGEIRHTLRRQIPKSTLSEWCKTVSLPKEYSSRIKELNVNNLNKGRLIALEVNRIKREKYLKEIYESNLPVSQSIYNLYSGKIALAMLCLGEASKYSTKTRSFSLGSSDPRIIIIFLELLKRCFRFDLEKVRCTVQCRADQNIQMLEEYWLNITKIPKRLFYKALIDPRTKGKPTKKPDYKGVLRVDYFDTKAQLELETLADLVYNKLAHKGP